MIKNNKEKIDFLKEEVIALELERNRLEKRLNQVCRELVQLRTECNHKDENGNDMTLYDSTDTISDFYKCCICGSYIKR